MRPIFADRSAAGRVLAELLRRYSQAHHAIVLGLPRGGVPVGYEVAHALHLPLDVFVVRKLGVPGHEELALGAIATGNTKVLNHDVISSLGIGEEAIEKVVAREQVELQRRERLFRGDQPPLDVAGRTVILVDDGLATGATMRAAVKAVQSRGCASIVVAVPVGAERTCDELRSDANDVVCARTPEPFYGVGMWYEEFSQTSDDEVRELLERARQEQSPAKA